MKNSQSESPPSWAIRILRWFCDPTLIEDVEGDLYELYTQRKEESGKPQNRWFILQVIRLFRPGIIRSFFNRSITQTTMVNHYFTTAFRHALRYKGHTFLNVFGLILGIGSALLILIYVNQEISVDKFHTKSDRIVRLWRNMHQTSGEINTTPAIPQPMELVLENEIPQVDEVTLVSWEMNFPVRHENHKSFYEGYYVSPEFFSIFSFNLIQGDQDRLFDNGESVVITDEMARSVFGEDWDTEALGSSIILNGEELFTVTGIIKKPGSNSSFQFKLLLPAATFIAQNDWVESWDNGGFRMYMTLHDQRDLSEVQALVKDEVNKHIENAGDEKIFLQPFTEMYMYGSFEGGVPVTGRIEYIRILTITALFLLLIASINYMNLTTAQSSRRSREVGLRKMFGARSGSLSIQFFVESFLIVSVAVLVSIGIVYLVLPLFSQVAGSTLIFPWDSQITWIFLPSLILGLTVFSGFYPALVMPAFEILSSLKNQSTQASGRSRLRKVLVVFQFALSMLLIIGTLVVTYQMNFILSKNLGVEKENRILIPTEHISPQNRLVLKEQALTHSSIKSLTLTSNNPLQAGWSTGGAVWDGKDPDEVAEIHMMNVDQDFFQTMGIKFMDGRGFSEEFASDSLNYVINGVAADLMGYDDPVGSDLSVWGNEGKIIGVVENFHVSNLYDPIFPLIMRLDPQQTYVAIAHITDPAQSIAYLKELITQLSPDMPFQYTFLDQDFASDYEAEQSVSTLMKLFSSLSIIIACLGLFGLISYSNEQRKKEIGIRKVMGASASGLTLMLAKDYLYMLFFAMAVASPIAWYLATNWLENFAFHINVTIWLFVLAGLILMSIALLTTGMKSYAAAMMDPVDSIRNE